MPAIPPETIDCIAYLYPDKISALAGERVGGCGCIVSVPAPEIHKDFCYVYVVTNSHVVRDGKSPVVRVNSRDGGLTIYDNVPGVWSDHPDGDDIAVAPVAFKYEEADVKAVPEDWFLTKQQLEDYKIGPGDEVVIVGRFINHEGKQRNLPAARFGHISMLPYEPVRTRRGLLQEVFLVECRSLPGYSGSPVFLAPLPGITYIERSVLTHAKFLGIDMGHIRDQRPVLDKAELNNDRYVPIDENWVVETNTGMSLVVPAWKIREVLYSEDLMKLRNDLAGELQHKKRQSPVAFDVATKEQCPLTQPEFETVLRKVSRRIAPSRSAPRKK